VPSVSGRCGHGAVLRLSHDAAPGSMSGILPRQALYDFVLQYLLFSLLDSIQSLIIRKSIEGEIMAPMASSAGPCEGRPYPAPSRETPAIPGSLAVRRRVTILDIKAIETRAGMLARNTLTRAK